MVQTKGAPPSVSGWRTSAGRASQCLEMVTSLNHEPDVAFPRQTPGSHAVSSYGDSWCERIGSSNPGSLTRGARETLRRSLTVDESKVFFAAASDERLEAYFVTTLPTGLRPGELGGLTQDNVDLDVGRLTVSKSMKTERNRPRLGATKRATAPLRTIDPSTGSSPSCAPTGLARPRGASPSARTGRRAGRGWSCLRAGATR